MISSRLCSPREPQASLRPSACASTRPCSSPTRGTTAPMPSPPSSPWWASEARCSACLSLILSPGSLLAQWYVIARNGTRTPSPSPNPNPNPDRRNIRTARTTSLGHVPCPKCHTICPPYPTLPFGATCHTLTLPPLVPRGRSSPWVCASCSRRLRSSQTRPTTGWCRRCSPWRSRSRESTGSTTSARDQWEEQPLSTSQSRWTISPHLARSPPCMARPPLLYFTRASLLIFTSLHHHHHLLLLLLTSPPSSSSHFLLLTSPPLTSSSPHFLLLTSPPLTSSSSSSSSPHFLLLTSPHLLLTSSHFLLTSPPSSSPHLLSLPPPPLTSPQVDPTLSASCAHHLAEEVRQRVLAETETEIAEVLVHVDTSPHDASCPLQVRTRIRTLSLHICRPRRPALTFSRVEVPSRRADGRPHRGPSPPRGRGGSRPAARDNQRDRRHAARACLLS